MSSRIVPTDRVIRINPGSRFPDIRLSVVGGGEASLAASEGRPKLIVVYRGAFWPFCQGSLTEINNKLGDLEASNFDVIAVSADKQDVAEKLVRDLNLRFPVAYGLEEDVMRVLGLYVSDPTNYIEQKHRFAEPGYFVLNPENQLKYVALSSHPMGGRVNVDALLAGYNWSQGRIKEAPEFASVFWGSA